MRLRAFLLTTFAGLAAWLPASAQGLAVGAQVGSPTGINLVFERPNGDVDLLFAWDLDDFFFVNGHLVWDRPVPDTDPNLRFFYGPGLFVGFDDRPRGLEDELGAGISGTFGVGYRFDRLEVFGQLTPRFLVLPETEADLGGGLGVRFSL